MKRSRRWRVVIVSGIIGGLLTWFYFNRAGTLPYGGSGGGSGYSDG